MPSSRLDIGQGIIVAVGDGKGAGVGVDMSCNAVCGVIVIGSEAGWVETCGGGRVGTGAISCKKAKSVTDTVATAGKIGVGAGKI